MGYKAILENCSKKLMISTIGYYKKLLPSLKLEFERTKILISDKWKVNYEQVNRQIIKQTKNLNNKLSICRSNKFNCDKLSYNLAVPILIELGKKDHHLFQFHHHTIAYNFKKSLMHFETVYGLAIYLDTKPTTICVMFMDHQ